jgi:hypothetical protein
VPARKRHRRQPESPDPIVRFARAVEETDEKRKERIRKEQAEKREAARQRKIAADHAKAVQRAQRDVDRAISRAKSARESGTGVAEADEQWKQAKARLIELETGEPPEWS